MSHTCDCFDHDARPPALPSCIIIVFKWIFLSGASQVVCSMTTLSDLLDQYNIRYVIDGDSATIAMSHV